MLKVEGNWAWHSPAMLGCSTECPNCQHRFVCCSPAPCCTTLSVRHSIHGFTGGNIELHQVSSRDSLSPQVSPSMPVEFVLPPIGSRQQIIPPGPGRPPLPHKTISERSELLKRTGWYYGHISIHQSQELLKNKSVGTFIVRDSSDPRFTYSLTVQTEKGPTSIRLHFVEGYYRLDAQPHLQDTMPRFSSVVELIEYYVKPCRNLAHVWVDPKGKWHSPIVIKKPLRQGDSPSSLKHLARLAVHSALQNSITAERDPTPHRHLDLPACLIKYLDEYPYTI